MNTLEMTFLKGVRNELATCLKSRGRGERIPQFSALEALKYRHWTLPFSANFSAAARICGFAVLIGLAAPTVAIAASLQVSPTTIEVNAPGATSSVSLVNPTPQPISVQVRVFKWTQTNGQERLEPTNDLVASPPFVTLPPSANYAVRLVRTATRPVQGEETYRLVIDELPQPGRLKAGAITLLLRQSLPVFFEAPDMRPAQVSWSYAKQGGKLLVTAKNDGDRRMRIGSFNMSNGKGGSASFGGGLLGYSLGRSVMTWAVPTKNANFSASGAITISGQSDLGPINAKAEPQGH